MNPDCSAPNQIIDTEIVYVACADFNLFRLNTTAVLRRIFLSRDGVFSARVTLEIDPLVVKAVV
jgi:hypothetical protein